jgi:GGDEF domain-containing protein
MMQYLARVCSVQSLNNDRQPVNLSLTHSSSTIRVLELPLLRPRLLRDNFQAFNKSGQHEFSLALSIGVVTIDRSSESTLEEHIDDQAMYRDKRRRKTKVAMGTDGHGSLNEPANQGEVYG